MDLFSRPAERKSLRPHQEKGIAALRRSLMGGKKRPVLMMATGGGKTLTAARIIEGALAKGNRVIFTAPAISLIDQTVDAFEAEGIAGIGVMQADHPRTNHAAPVQVASVQTLAKRSIPAASLVIVDECHIRAKVIEELMEDRPDLVFLGLSATPWAAGMGLIWDDLVVAATTGDLIRAGYLCPFRVFAGAMPDLSKVRTRMGEFVESDLEEAMGTKEITGDVVANWLEKGENRPTLLFAVNRAHAAQLHAAFQRAGVAAAYVDMNTDRIERKLIERGFRDGEIKVACSVRTLTTGVDWPVACIVDAAPTKSSMLHVQKIGRGLRVNPPWPDCLVFDHGGNTARLGFVSDIHRTALSVNPRKEASAASGAADDELPPVTCVKCAAILPARTNPCTVCGHERTRAAGIEVVEGELREITKGQRKQLVASREEKQRFWSMALHLDHGRGKAGKLALSLYKNKFGVWPRALDDVRLPPDAAFMHYEKSRRIAYAKGKRSQEHQRGAA